MSRRHNRGAVLVVTLLLLLAITLLAVSSVRDSAMEIRVMARELDHQRLFNAAEAGLREAERQIAQLSAPLQDCGKGLCLQGLANNNAVDFAHATPYRGAAVMGAEPASVRWYIRLIPVQTTQAVDAQYGAAARPGGTYYYEVNSQALFAQQAPADINGNCAAAVVCLRSVVARTFIEGRP